jgi:peptidylprolyl isomerase
MLSKLKFAFPFMALALVAAKPVPPPTPAGPPIIPPVEIAQDPNNVLKLSLSDGGHVVILMRPDAAPHHVERIRELVRKGFYNGVIFHRVIPGFMAQTGDPTGTGAGGSDLPDMKAEFNTLPHMRGVVAGARTDSPDTFNSQFFIMYTARFGLDHKYTVFGRVISGMDAVDRIAQGEPPQNPTRIIAATIGDEPAGPPNPKVVSTPAATTSAVAPGVAAKNSSDHFSDPSAN